MINKIVIMFLVVISILGKNKSMAYAGLIVLILSFVGNHKIIQFTRNNFLDIGLVFLMVWMLVPLIDTKDKIDIFNMKNNKEDFKNERLNMKNSFNVNTIVSFLSGLFVVIIAAKGTNYLNGNAPALVGIILGSIVGVTFFGGVPVGMLTGSGVAYLIIRLLGKE